MFFLFDPVARDVLHDGVFEGNFLEYLKRRSSRGLKFILEDIMGRLLMFVSMWFFLIVMLIICIVERKPLFSR
uniref:Small integral membrane protein 7 n=1 Tax=Strongyloides papillosus TaxID=174720 RepID=A0A0N5BFU5_STREA